MKALVNAALSGIWVLDFTRHAPGPFCTYLLQSMGARVWKVEEPRRGDPLRSLAPEAFRRLNAGKMSVTADLKTEGGRALVVKIAEKADVLLEGFRPGVMESFGLSYEALSARFPRLVYASITGYGQDGPDRARGGHDLNYMARAGALGSEVPPIQVADFAGGGLMAALSVVSALYARETTGKGAYLDVSMVEGARLLTTLAATPGGELLRGAFPCYGIYATRDGGRLTVGALEPKFWRAFCEGIERPELSERAFDKSARAEVESALLAHPLETWLETFATRDACVEPVAPPELEPLPDAAPELGEHTREAEEGE